MTTEKLTVTRTGDTLAITNTAPSTGLPTIVITLGPTLTAEINPSSDLPVRITTEDYTHDKQRIDTLLSTDTTTHIDTTGDGTYPLPFTPTPAWNTVLDLAQQQWQFRWNPLPLDPELLALDLLRAQHEAITLTENLPDRHLALTAYPAAQTLQRLIDANTITPKPGTSSSKPSRPPTPTHP
ncbi:hypothetical protein NHF46_11750 [Arthrobacter alpinus]|nr:hypothetical protein [Arthrobacter alpinus]